MRFTNPSPVPTVPDTAVPITITGVDNVFTIDVSQSASISLSWFWKIGTVKTVLNGAGGNRWFARLQMQWLDSLGNIIAADDVQLIHESAATIGASSRVGQFRSPCIGSTLKLVFQSVGFGFTLAANDSAVISAITSLRSIPKATYNSYLNSVPATLGDDGSLMQLTTTGIAISTTTFIRYADAFDGLTELIAWTQQAGTIAVYIGAYALGNLITSGTGLVYNITTTAGAFQKLTFQCPRTNIGVTFSNGAVGTSIFQCTINRGDL